MVTTCAICDGPLPANRKVVCSRRCANQRQNASDAYQRARARWLAKGGGQHQIRCDHCSRTAMVQKRSARFCSHDCSNAWRRENPIHGPRRSDFIPVPCTALEVWKPPLFPEPRVVVGQSWWRLLVFGPCEWCDEPFMGPAADYDRRSLYCSLRCSRSASKYRRGRFLVPPRVRQEIYERDNWICQLCDGNVDPELPPSDVWAATLDHIIPRSTTLFPDDSPENLQLAHRWCNSVKGDETYYSAADLAA